MTIVYQQLEPISELSPIVTGNSPYDGGNLILTSQEKRAILAAYPTLSPLIRPLCGAQEYLNGEQRYCLWINDTALGLAEAARPVQERIERVRQFRLNGGDVARGLVARSHQFRYVHEARTYSIIAPRVSSERRAYVPFGVLPSQVIISDSAQAIYDPETWNLSVILSLMHVAWVRTLAGRLKTDVRYSSALCYNTFPIPTLTAKNKADLSRCAEDILIAREAHFPATIAELYDPERMPADLRAAHDRNDEVLERIYIGRRFRNDTERLEKLFELYSKMVASKARAR